MKELQISQKENQQTGSGQKKKLILNEDETTDFRKDQCTRN